MKVSIILPNYNHSKYLRQRIESILNQSYSDYELIILDDNSTDDSRDIIEQYRKHPKISHVVYNDQNSGSTFYQWKKGISLAKGEYIWIAESDDFCSTTFLKECIYVLERYPNVSIVFTDSVLVDSEGIIFKRKYTLLGKMWNKYMYSFRCIKGNKLIKRMLFRNIIINASAVVFRKRYVSQTPTCVHYKLCGDWLFWSSFMKDTDVVYINQKLNFFRQHTNKVTPLAVRKGLDLIEGLDVLNAITRLYHVPLFYYLASIGSFYNRIKKRSFETESLKYLVTSKWEKLYPHIMLYKVCYILISFYIILLQPILYFKNK